MHGRAQVHGSRCFRMHVDVTLEVEGDYNMNISLRFILVMLKTHRSTDIYIASDPEILMYLE